MIICKRPVSQTEGGEKGKGEGGENGEDERRLLWTDRTDDMEGDPRGHKKKGCIRFLWIIILILIKYQWEHFC